MLRRILNDDIRGITIWDADSNLAVIEGSNTGICTIQLSSEPPVTLRIQTAPSNSDIHNIAITIANNAIYKK